MGLVVLLGRDFGDLRNDPGISDVSGCKSGIDNSFSWCIVSISLWICFEGSLSLSSVESCSVAIDGFSWCGGSSASSFIACGRLLRVSRIIVTSPESSGANLTLVDSTTLFLEGIHIRKIFVLLVYPTNLPSSALGRSFEPGGREYS